MFELAVVAAAAVALVAIVEWWRGPDIPTR
jgi:hypothetical protein